MPYPELRYRYVTPELWEYLRPGLEYLETSAQGVPLTFKHPGGRAYGPLGLSPVAFLDVQRLYPEFKGYSFFEDILASPELYNLASRAYADALLGYYLHSPRGRLEDIFNILQRYWYTGPKGGPVPTRRRKRAQEWLTELSGFAPPSQELRERLPPWVLW